MHFITCLYDLEMLQEWLDSYVNVEASAVIQEHCQKSAFFLLLFGGIVACWFSDAALQQGWLGGGFLAFSFTCSATVKCLLLMKILCCPVWFFYTVNWRAKWQQMWCSGFFLWFMLWFIWKAATYVREQSEYLCEQHSDSGLPWLTGLEGLISY